MIKIIDGKLLDDTSDKARQSPRLRMNHNLHELEDRVQRMLNAIEPGSYIRPHRHLDPDKTELFLILKGIGAVITFSDTGETKDIVIMGKRYGTMGVEIPPGVWHTVVSLESGTVFMEIKDGPYTASTDKDFAPWAPNPEDEEAKVYLKELEEKIFSI